MKKKTFLAGFVLLCFAGVLSAQNIPRLAGSPVVDQAGILSAADKNQLTSLSFALMDATGVQMAVLTVPDLQGYPIEEFSFRAAEEWQLGQKGENNGVLILLAMEERKIRIEVGYGLEDRLTDLKSGYILGEKAIPAFREGNYSKGLLDTATAVVGVVSGDADISQAELTRYQESQDSPLDLFEVFIIIIFFLVMFLNILLRGGRRGRRGPRYYGGPPRGGSSFGGGFSGGGGRSFSGGGGSFGGGGASRGW